jgi:signal transduction histidine kinase
MPMKKSFVLVAVIVIVGLLLLLNFFLLKKNSSIIDQNKAKLENAALIRVRIAEVISNLHLLDLGIRGFALVNNKQIETSMDTAVVNNRKIYSRLESGLQKQGFPMKDIILLRDTVDNYFNWVAEIRTRLNEGKRKEAIEMINQDRGYFVWLFHKKVALKVNQFEDTIVARAGEDYQIALRNSYLLQLILFLIIVPTLIYLVYFTIRSFKLSEELLLSQKERNKILFSQNEMLEKMVHERTQEIAAQNEEITGQNEEIQTYNEKLLAQQKEIEKQSSLLVTRNRELEEANDIILQQKELIEERNVQLSSELEIQNQELRASNYELVHRTNRIEQFAYMISHNLRAPIARLLGLTNIFKSATSEEERNDLINKTNLSASELDQVVKDLSGIMQIHRLSTEVFSEVNFENVLKKVKQILETEIRETRAEFQISFNKKSFYSLPPYIDNIFYNLISNSIKYRHSQRSPIISIKSNLIENVIVLEFSDNGLGLDKNAYKENIFGLYKRVHFHVEGRGIGLYLVKSQIEMLGGTIEVHSEVDNGTTFRINLPNKMI